jgi:hypothetical protein
MALRLGRHTEGRSLAQQVLTVLERERTDRSPQCTFATQGEAYVLVGHMEKARRSRTERPYPSVAPIMSRLPLCGREHVSISKHSDLIVPRWTTC